MQTQMSHMHQYTQEGKAYQSRNWEGTSAQCLDFLTEIKRSCYVFLVKWAGVQPNVSNAGFEPEGK
jgi:hypothetical protein